MKFNIGIDIGTRNVRMAVEGYGVAFTASSAVAVQKGADMPVAFGDEALSMLGRMYAGGSVVFPIVSGICEDEALLVKWLLALFERARAIARLRKIHLLFGCAGWLQKPHQYALMQAALDAGADSVALVRSDAAGAIGAGLSILEPEASFVVEAGAGGIGASLFSFGRTVASVQAPHGLAGVDEALVRALRAQGVRVGPRTAEAAKLALATAGGAQETLAFSGAGFDEKTNLPRIVTINAQTVNALVEPYVRELISMAGEALAQAPIELAADLAERGAYLIGGGARLFALDTRLRDALGIPVWIPENAADCAARGLSAMIEAGDTYERLLLDSAGASA